MLNSIFSEASSSIELTAILICMVSAIILGLIIAFVHLKTSKYSKNFLITLATLPLLVAAIIIMVNGNLGTSVAILGAFSLVRFRSLPGTSKEILSVFFAMTVGLALGMGHVNFAILVTLITALVILGINKIKLFDRNQRERILKITLPENLDYSTIFDDVFKEYAETTKLEQLKTINLGSLFELNYKIILKEDINEKEFIDQLRIKNGNLKIVLTHPVDEYDF